MKSSTPLVTYWERMRMLNWDARWFLFSAFLLGMGYAGIIGLLFNLLLLRLGYGPEFIGVISGVGSLSQSDSPCLPASWEGDGDLVAQCL